MKSRYTRTFHKRSNVLNVVINASSREEGRQTQLKVGAERFRNKHSNVLTVVMNAS